MSCEDIGEKYYMYIHPKTVEAAVSLAKKKEKLEEYEGPGMYDEIEVETNLKLLSEEKSNIDPSDIASVTVTWNVSSCEKDEDVEREMLEEMKTEFKDMGLKLDDYKYDYDYEIEEDW